MKLNLRHLSIRQTEVLKGLGILVIVLHNFFHVLTPKVGENEFLFSHETFQNFLATLLDNPLELVRLVFSYFGHYGVHVFVFLSAYGLSRKHHTQRLAVVPFLKSRFERVYLSFLLCAALFVVLKLASATLSGREPDLAWDSVLWKLLLVSNFIPDQAMYPTGPWWFIPFIMQFYLVYPLLLHGYRRFGNSLLLGLTALSIACEWFFNPLLVSQGLNINHTVFGHLPVVCLGIFMANQEALELRSGHIAIALLLFIGGNFNAELWLVSDLSFTALFLAAFMIVCNRPSYHPGAARPWVFYGGLSFHLFMVNGFLRPPFVTFAESQNIWWVDIVCGFAALGFATACAGLLRWFDERLRAAHARGAPA